MRWLVLISVLIFSSTENCAAKCVGRFMNPITDVCWKCIFPIRISGITVASSSVADPKTFSSPICFCKRPGIPVPVPGLPISFWEPVRMVDVTRDPYCLVNMGGLKINNTGIRDRGEVKQETKNPSQKSSYYQVHWYRYPVLAILEVLLDFACLDGGSPDVAYMTELEPLWNDDAKSAILHPEAALFANPIAQGACIADCAAASARLPRDELFWCSGCQGSVYPFTGTVSNHTGGVQAGLLLTTRIIAKLHRQFMLWGYVGKQGLCGKYPMPILRKSQYRTQMTYPIAQTGACQPLGATEVIWQAGREYPFRGSDFGFLIWRKRDCCLL